MAKFQFLGDFPSLTVHVRVSKRETRKITLTGSGEISDDDLKDLLKIPNIQTMVAEGILRFPGNKAMEELHGRKQKQRIQRMKVLSADQDERKEAKEDRLATEDEVKRLEAENAEMRKAMNQQDDRLAKLEAAADKSPVKKEPVKKPEPPKPATQTQTAPATGAGKDVETKTGTK